MTEKQQERIIDFIVEQEDVFGIPEIIDYLGLKRTDKRFEEIEDFLFESFIVVKNVNGEYFYKGNVLSEIPIRILPTQFEIDKGVLILGHRIVPFHPVTDINSVTLFYDSVKCKKTKIKTNFDDIQIYYSLTSLYQIPINNDSIDESNSLDLEVYDMKSFYSKNNFKFGDTIVLKTKNFKNGLFDMFYDSAENFNKDISKVRKTEANFMKSLMKVIEEFNIDIIDTDYQLVLAYCLNRKNFVDIAMSPLGILLSKQKEIVFSRLPDGSSIFHKANENPLDSIYDFNNINEREIYKDINFNTIDGILEYLGCNFSVVYIKALIYDQFAFGNYNYESIYERAFKNRLNLFPDKELSDKFKSLVDKEAQKIHNILSKSFSPLEVNLVRKKCLELLDYNTDFLRLLDQKMVDLDDLPKDDMIQIVTITGFLDNMLKLLEKEIVKSKKINIKELEKTHKEIEKLEKPLLEIIAGVKKKLKI